MVSSDFFSFWPGRGGRKGVRILWFFGPKLFPIFRFFLPVSFLVLCASFSFVGSFAQKQWTIC